MSLWQRFTAWLRGLFQRTTPQTEPELEPEPEQPPKPSYHYRIFIERPNQPTGPPVLQDFDHPVSEGEPFKLAGVEYVAVRLSEGEIWAKPAPPLPTGA